MEDKPWKRDLWSKQAFPDNYVPPSFLSSLQRNANVKPYSYWDITSQACAVTQQMSAISIFSSTFILLLDKRLDPRLLAAISLVSFVLGFLAWEIISPTPDIRALWSLRSNTMKSSILVLLLLTALSPVLRTLTASTSSDSIWPLAGVLLVLNGLLADYSGRTKASPERLISVMSVNAALSASVVLASRLSDDSSVFAMILLSLLFFGQIPMLRNRAPGSTGGWRLLFTLVLTAATVVLAASVSILHALLSGGILLFVTFGAPQLLIWSQLFKNEIRGPWDVAAPIVLSK